MTLLLKDGDYTRDSAGRLTSLSGNDEMLQRVLIRLAARRGGFPLMPTLGSRLHLLSRQSPANREALARQYVQEALAEETELTVTGVTLTPLDRDRIRISVSLLCRTETLTIGLDLT